MKKIQINSDVYYIPSEWDELSLEQLEFLARVSQGPQPLEQLKILMMLKVFDAKVQYHSKIYPDRTMIKFGVEPERVSFRAKGKLRYLLTPTEVNALAEQFAWILGSRQLDSTVPNSPAVQWFIDSRLTTNPYTTIRVRWRKLHAPETLFELPYHQYIYLQTYLDGAKTDGMNLNRALACVWHRGTSFSWDHLDEDAKLISRLPKETKTIMYWFIVGSMNMFAQNFGNVFSGHGDRVVGNTLDRQFRLLDSLAKHDITKKEKIRQSATLDVLYALDGIIEEQKAREDAMQDATRR